VAPTPGYSCALCDGDDCDADEEAQRDAEEAEDDETYRPTLGKVMSSRRGETDQATERSEQM